MPAFHTLSLHTPRLLLRPLAPGDAADLLAIHADERVMRYGNELPWSSLEQAATFIARDGEGMAAGRHLCLGLVTMGADLGGSPGRLIGTCTLFSFLRGSRRAELGFALASSAWGHGWMSEALRAMLDHAFGPLDLNRVEADTDPRNEPSVRLLQRLGFRAEGVLRERWLIDGQPSDSAMFGLLQREWRAGR